jgi:hypothetical protein
MDDPAVTALAELVPGGVRRGELRRGDRVLRWVETGAGPATVILDAGAAEPGSLAWAGVLPALPAQARLIAWPRTDIQAWSRAWSWSTQRTRRSWLRRRGRCGS